MNAPLLRDAAEWRLISLLFECPVAGWREQVAALARQISDPDLQSIAAAACNEANEALYHTAFGPGGPAAAREVSYRTSILPGQLLGELMGFYNAFAYQPILPEAPDHIAIEAGFIAYLLLKEAYARERDDAAQASVASEGAKRFMQDHLSTMAGPLSKSLAASGISYLAKNAQALLRRVGHCSQRQSVGTMPVPPDEESGCACSGTS